MGEQDLRHRLIAAGGGPGGAEVAPADVHGDGHVVGLGLQHLVQDVDILAAHLVHVDAPLGIGLPLLGGAELAPGGVVQLEIAAAGGVERLHGLLIGGGQVVQQDLLVLIARDGLVVRLPDAADQVEHGGGGDALLGLHAVLAGDLVQELEVGQEGVVLGEVQLVHDLHRFRLGLEALKGHGEVLGLHLLGAGQAPQKVHVPEGAAILAIGDGAEAHILLLADQAADLLVLHGGQLLGGELAGGELLPGGLDGLGAEEAADNIITVGGVLRHEKQILSVLRGSGVVFPMSLVYLSGAGL